MQIRHKIILLLAFYLFTTSSWAKSDASGCDIITVDNLEIEYRHSKSYIRKAMKMFDNFVIHNWENPPVPFALTYPKNEQEISQIIQWAKQCEKPLCVRNGGHSYEWFSTCNDGVVVNMKNFNSLSYNDKTGIATIGAGNTNWTTYNYLFKKGRTLPSGSCGSVGITGLTLAGGLSILQRYAGMTIDRLVELKMVLASGEVVIVNKQQHPDLFWASQGGGGGNFGIVTELRYATVKTPSKVLQFDVTWDNHDNLQQVMSAFEDWIPSAKKEFFVFVHLRTKDTNGAPISVGGVRIVRDDETTENAKADIIHFLKKIKAPPTKGNSYKIVGPHYWDWVVKYYEWPYNPDGSSITKKWPYKATSHMVRRPNLWKDVVFVKQVKDILGQISKLDIQFDTFGGKESIAASIANNATAFPWRDSLYTIQYMYQNAERNPAELYTFYNFMDKHVRHAAYRNYPDLNLPNWEKRYYGENLDRLMSIKACYDKNNFFNYGQSIPLAAKAIKDCPFNK